MKDYIVQLITEHLLKILGILFLTGLSASCIIGLNGFDIGNPQELMAILTPEGKPMREKDARYLARNPYGYDYWSLIHNNREETLEIFYNWEYAIKEREILLLEKNPIAGERSQEIIKDLNRIRSNRVWVQRAQVWVRENLRR